MKQSSNERGYALLIVLLLIVFITILTAVFLRGSISNAKQEKIVDNSHLTVMAAEAGVDYYKTLFSNEYYDKIDNVEMEATEYLEYILTNNKGERRTPTVADYLETRKFAVSNLKKYLNLYSKEISYEPIQLSTENNDFEFVLDKTKKFTVDILNDTSVRVSCAIIGTEKSKGETKMLTFNQIFMVPSFNPADIENNDSVDTGTDDWTYPVHDQPTIICSDKEKLENENCYVELSRGKISELQNSIVYFPRGYEAKEIKIRNSIVRMKHNLKVTEGDLDIQKKLFTVEGNVDAKEKIEIEESNIAIKGNVSSAKGLDVQKSKSINIGGALYEGTKVQFEKSNVAVNGSLATGTEVDIQESKSINIGGALSAGTKVKFEKSNVAVEGSLSSGTELDIQKSKNVKIGGALSAGTKLKLQESNIRVEGALSAGTELEIQNSSYIEVNWGLNSDGKFALEDSSMAVIGNVNLGNNGQYGNDDEAKIESSNVTINGNLHFKGKKTKVDNESNICISGKVIVNNEFSISNDSRIYYSSGDSPQVKPEYLKHFVKIPADEFSEKCPITPVDIKVPKLPDLSNDNVVEGPIKWPSPSLEVEYIKETKR